VLAFIGAKMLLDPHGEPTYWFQRKIPTGVSLLVVAVIILLSVIFSIIAARRERQARRHGADKADGTAEP
jgi:hypothetical protein